MLSTLLKEKLLEDVLDKPNCSLIEISLPTTVLYSDSKTAGSLTNTALSTFLGLALPSIIVLCKIVFNLLTNL